MHTRTIPVGVAQGLGVPLDSVAVFLCGTLEQVAAQPDFVAGTLGALGEDLEFPLAGGHFSVDTFNVQAGF